MEQPGRALANHRNREDARPAIATRRPTLASARRTSIGWKAWERPMRPPWAATRRLPAGEKNLTRACLSSSGSASAGGGGFSGGGRDARKLPPSLHRPVERNREFLVRAAP